MVTVVAIIISTADSFLHVPATSVVNDLLPALHTPRCFTETYRLGESFLSLLSSASLRTSSRGCSRRRLDSFKKRFTRLRFMVHVSRHPLVAALVWERATKQGAIASMCTGAIVTLAWNEVGFLKQRLPEAVTDLDAVLPAITLSVTMLVVVSLMTRPADPRASDLAPPPEPSNG